jgi:hypothetical protein
MSHQILSLLLKSARLQRKITDANAQPNADRLHILRLQTVRLMLLKRIQKIAGSLPNTGRQPPLDRRSYRAPIGRLPSALALN